MKTLRAIVDSYYGGSGGPLSSLSRTDSTSSAAAAGKHSDLGSQPLSPIVLGYVLWGYHDLYVLLSTSPVNVTAFD